MDLDQEQGRVLKELGQMLKAQREAALLTQEALAHRMGTTSQVISRVEGGHRNVSLDWLVKHAEALGLRLVITPNKTTWNTQKNSRYNAPSDGV